MRVAAVALFLAGLVVGVPFVVAAAGGLCDENCGGGSGGLVFVGVAGLIALWAAAAWLYWKAARSAGQTSDGEHR